MELKGKSAIVTGGTRGIGRAVALALAREGCNVTINFRKSDKEAKEVVKEIKKMKRDALAVKADVSNYADAQAMFKKVVKKFGSLEILVSNAGINWDGVIWKMSEKQFDTVINTNLKGCFNYNKLAAEVFKDQRYGKIVNISSINGLRGKFGQTNYSASKGGEIAMSKALAKEVGKFNINVNVICPGMVMTEMAEKIPQEFLDKAVDETVLGRIASSDDIANVVVFLCSDKSRHITGEVIKVDGGQYTEEDTMTKVAIVGVGHGRFGRRSDATVQELAFEAFRDSLEDAKNLDRKDIDAVVIGSSPEYHKQRSLPGVVTEYIGMNDKPTWLTEAACASASAALRTAYMAVKSGVHDTVLVLGVQKMTELSTPEILGLMGRVGDVQWESIYGTTFPGYYALYAQRHMYEFGTKPEHLAAVAVKNHHYGAQNPYALFRKEVTMERCLSSQMIASPLRMFDCCANADGAAALIVTNKKKAKKYNDTPVWLDGAGCASAPISVLRRPDMTTIPSAVKASKEAYKQAKVGPKDIDIADVHDCFTIAEIMAIEDIGFVKKGKGGKYVEDGQTYIGGEHPVNVDGGLKSKGHPVGATGASQTVEIVKQLRGDCGQRQIKGAKVGLTHNVGGIGQYCFVNIYKR